MLTIPHRKVRSTIALVCLVVLAILLPGNAAVAAPGDENEGTTPSVRQALDIALREYNDAQGRLASSRERQAKLADEAKTSELRFNLLSAEANSIAAAAYRGTRMNANLILTTGSPDGFLHAVTTVRYLTIRDDRQLRELAAARRTHDEKVRQVAEEIRLQEQQVATMAKRKKDAEDALQRAGGGQLSSGVVAGKATAKPAPRNADGSWPSESCNQDDPTTSGCLTPRTLHAYNEARLAGYTRYTACFRQAGSGEHPKGRACDFAPTTQGFVNAIPTGSDKAYGDRLAGWLIGNANVLGVMYVIWFKQIWMPGSGWQSYSGDGTPAGDHYNHVHLSMV